MDGYVVWNIFRDAWCRDEYQAIQTIQERRRKERWEQHICLLGQVWLFFFEDASSKDVEKWKQMSWQDQQTCCLSFLFKVFQKLFLDTDEKIHFLWVWSECLFPSSVPLLCRTERSITFIPFWNNYRRLQKQLSFHSLSYPSLSYSHGTFTYSQLIQMEALLL